LCGSGLFKGKAMNRIQQFVLVTGLLAVLVAGTVPPWRYVGATTPTDTYDVSAGHSFVIPPRVYWVG
jgi:hypothetical protein